MSASRIANVSVAVFTRSSAEGEPGSAAAARPGEDGQAARARALAARCGGLFEDVLRVGGSEAGASWGRFVRWPAEGGHARLGALLAALEAARGERVIVVEPEVCDVGVEVLLALVAWPEQSIVQPIDLGGGELPVSIYRRAECLARGAALEEADRAAGSLDVLHRALEVARVPLSILGLSSSPHPLFDRGEGG